jgi:cytochrome b pre-mRNA-processing protein 3
MPSFLFPRLTPPDSRGQALFGSLVGEARQRHWYVEGQVPDTIDGRFAVLATVAALAIVRLERGAAGAQAAAVALTERFVEAMDSEHRQLGIGEPTLGKTVRKLVGALGRRAELWRRALAHRDEWERAVGRSLFKDHPPSFAALDHCAEALHDLWARIDRSSDGALAEGRIG